MKQYLENTFDAFVFVATIVASIVSIVGLILLLGGNDRISLSVEVISLVVTILGVGYIVTLD